MEGIINLFPQCIYGLRHVSLGQRSENRLPHRAVGVLKSRGRIGFDGGHKVLGETLGLRMNQSTHVLKFLGSGVADKGDVIGVVYVCAGGRDVRKIIRKRYLTVVAGHLDLGFSLFQGLVVLDRHFAALFQRQSLLGIHRHGHQSHSDQC